MSTYDITIAGVGGSSPSNGFIDHMTIYQYMAASSNPATYATSTAKSRANRRHKSVVTMIQFYSNLEIISVTAGGSPAADTAPTSMIYRVNGDTSLVRTPDEDNPGTFLTGNAAVKRIVSRALMKAETVGLEIFDPTTSTAPGNSTVYNRTGPRFESTVVGALYTVRATAEASVSIATV